MSASDDTLDTDSRAAAARRAEPSDRGFIVVGTAPDASSALLGAWLPLLHGDRAMLLGRTGDDANDRLTTVRQRPGVNEKGPDLDDPFLSRDQLRITARADGIHVENVGKRELLVGNRVVDEATVNEGEVVEVKGRLLLLAARRPRVTPALQNLSKERPAFGAADTHGFVGESIAAWRLRDSAAFVAARSAHVLLLGASGTGKEIVARSIHALSKGSKRLVSRNAATLPSGLIDAELFGHVANYPNAGMPERPGLVGEADGGTLFLDEIGELPAELATKLLRVLDERGEYQRLGDTRTRNSKFRLIAATNREVTALKSDVAARFKLRIMTPGLEERREDIPLLARHLLQRAAAEDPAIGERFFAHWDGRTGEPRIALDLMRTLVLHAYSTHIRELEVLLWAALSESSGDTAELVPEVERALTEGAPSQAPRVDVRDLTAEVIRAAIERAGSHERAWRDLGLANRHVLKRLVKKHGLRD